MTAQSIYLIGPMGAGKTSVGKRLAKMLGLKFADLDQAIVDRCGVPVDWIFDVEGESGFREREQETLRDLTESAEPLLIATGGGVVLSAENRRLLAARGLVVYLATTVDQQLRRLRTDKKRPLLRGRNRRQRLEALAAQRDPLYESIADVTVPTGGSAARTAHSVAAAVEAFQRGGSAASTRSSAC